MTNPLNNEDDNIAWYGEVVTTLQIGSYSGLDSSPYGIPTGNHIEDRPVYLVYYQ